MEKVIHFSLYNPKQSPFKGSGNDKAVCTTVTCSNCENCTLYKNKQCATITMLGSSNCPYGKRSKKYGFTPRAQKYNEWIIDKKKKYEGITYLNGYSMDILHVIGDYIFLPYSFMNKCEKIPWGIEANYQNGGAFYSGSYWLKKEHFTKENIIELIKYRPQALFGGEITEYQKKIVPKFIIHLKENFPDIVEELCEEVPKVKEVLESHTDILPTNEFGGF